MEVPDGDVVDRITILEIKVQRLRPSAAEAAAEELQVLVEAWQASGHTQLAELAGVERLRVVNRSLWDVEDALRACERAQQFDGRFVELARSVYVLNDERAALKRAISEAVGSRLVEQKGY